MNKLIALAIVAGLAPLAFADGNTATATAQSSVTILAPVKVTTSGALEFGKVVVTGPTTIKINSLAVVTGDANSIPFSGSAKITATVPTFTITKDAMAHVAVTITPSFTQGGVLTIDPDVLTRANTFATSGDAALTNEKLYGSLRFDVPVYGVITGQVVIQATYL